MTASSISSTDTKLWISNEAIFAWARNLISPIVNFTLNSPDKADFGQSWDIFVQTERRRHELERVNAVNNRLWLKNQLKSHTTFNSPASRGTQRKTARFPSTCRAMEWSGRGPLTACRPPPCCTRSSLEFGIEYINWRWFNFNFLPIFTHANSTRHSVTSLESLEWGRRGFGLPKKG